MAQLIGPIFVHPAPPLSALAATLIGFPRVMFVSDYRDDGDVPDEIRVVIEDRYGTVIIRDFDPARQRGPCDLSIIPAAARPARAHEFVMHPFRPIDQSLVKRIITTLARHFTFWIDTHFVVLTSEAFVVRCHQEPRWDLFSP